MIAYKIKQWDFSIKLREKSAEGKKYIVIRSLGSKGGERIAKQRVTISINTLLLEVELLRRLREQRNHLQSRTISPRFSE